MIDLAQEWRVLDRTRRRPDSADHWDKRAKTYTFKDAPGSYVESFIEKMNLDGAERILDMGCGTGSIAIPLASRGHEVIAADFSKGMLERVENNAQVAHVLHPDYLAESVDLSLVVPRMGDESRKEGVFPLYMSWEDDWNSFGLGAKSVDVCVASRSIITHDLEESIQKLSNTARKSVCVTAATKHSPRIDERVARAMGLNLKKHNDALYVFGIAMDLGYEPEVSYIRSRKLKSFATRDEAFQSYLSILEYVDDSAEQVSIDEAQERLNAWLDEHLVCKSDATSPSNGESLVWTLDEPRIVSWAFISWRV